jgi:hypothetical protein
MEIVSIIFNLLTIHWFFVSNINCKANFTYCQVSIDSIYEIDTNADLAKRRTEIRGRSPFFSETNGGSIR